MLRWVVMCYVVLCCIWRRAVGSAFGPSLKWAVTALRAEHLRKQLFKMHAKDLKSIGFTMIERKGHSSYDDSDEKPFILQICCGRIVTNVMDFQHLMLELRLFVSE